jgi:3-dehydroquinate synthase
MHTIQQSFTVSFNYPVHFTENAFQPANPLLADLVKNSYKPKLLFIIDDGVAEHHPDLAKNIESYCKHYQKGFTLCGNPLIVPGGEKSKSDTTVLQQILDAVNQYGIDRHSYLVAIGGGALLDVAGFAAAIAHRGIRHLRFPTTVLSQNDSGVGVKNGINAYGKKNFLGTFAPPHAVINDFSFLTTLDDRDWRSGIAEAIKVALIKDARFFEEIQKNAEKLAARELPPMQQLIHRCAEMHIDHIASGDPFETGSSRPLDFGHWTAHKLEQLTHYETRHGEAVAIGMALDVTYSHLAGMLTEEECNQVIHLIRQLGFQLYVPELAATSGNTYKVLEGLNEFREHLGGQLTIMLLKSIGKGVEVHEMDEKLILAAIKKLEEFQLVSL